MLQRPLERKRLASALVVALTLTLAATAAFAEDIAVSPEARLELVVKGGSVIVEPGDAKIVRVMGVDASYRVSANDGRVRVKMSNRNNGESKIVISIPPTMPVEINQKIGMVETHELGGPIDVKIRGGFLRMRQSTGDLKVEMKDGVLDVRDYAGEGKSVSIEGKDGWVDLSLAAKKPGRGIVHLKKGRVNFSSARETVMQLHAEVEDEGEVITNQPLNRPDPKVLYVTTNRGKTSWDLTVDEGTIRVEMPR